ncbi:MAG: shikimate dehydrogenase [Gemmataceae bacterium]
MPAPRVFQTELFACFGQPVAENPTQAMIEAAFRDMGLDWRYLTIEVAPEGLADAIRGLRAMGFRGANCTLPHKVAVMPHLDELTPTAQAIGAVNCIVRQGHRLLGENTDGKGFLQSVTALGPVRGQRVVLLGAGGAARAIGVELLNAGAGFITVVNRDLQRGEELLQRLADLAPGKVALVPWHSDYVIPADTHIIINATSIGLFPDVDARVPIRVESLQPSMLVCDVIPNPPHTRLLQAAEQRGCRTLDGLGMLVNQGVIGIRLWAGRDPNPLVMRQALNEVFGTQ